MGTKSSMFADKTSDIMMARIKSFQRIQNIYSKANNNRYAYVPLEWNIGERLIEGFVNNIKTGISLIHYILYIIYH